jgi:hypothetical protein
MSIRNPDEPVCAMDDISLYDPKLYDDWVKSWRTIGYTKPSPEVKRISSLWFKFCPDGQKHNYRTVPEESYMCDTMYKCTRCGKKMRQDSSD